MDDIRAQLDALMGSDRNIPLNERDRHRWGLKKQQNGRTARSPREGQAQGLAVAAAAMPLPLSSTAARDCRFGPAVCMVPNPLRLPPLLSFVLAPPGSAAACMHACCSRHSPTSSSPPSSPQYF